MQSRGIELSEQKQQLGFMLTQAEGQRSCLEHASSLLQKAERPARRAVENAKRDAAAARKSAELMMEEESRLRSSSAALPPMPWQLPRGCQRQLQGQKQLPRSSPLWSLPASRRTRARSAILGTLQAPHRHHRRLEKVAGGHPQKVKGVNGYVL